MASTNTRRSSTRSTRTQTTDPVISPEETETPEIVTEENVVETATPEITDNVVETEDSNVTEEVAEEETPKNRIPKVLEGELIFVGLMQSYLDTVDKIVAYNKTVLASKKSEWNGRKVLQESEKFARPTDGSDADKDILAAREAWEKLVNDANVARQAVISLTAQKLGINLSAVADRDESVENELGEARKNGIMIGTQLRDISGLVGNPEAAKAIEEFLTANGMPAIGRDQVRTFGSNDGTSSSGNTPKYRVNVSVVEAETDETVQESGGITKTALDMKKKYNKDEEAITSEMLRKAWEGAGNNSEKTVQDTVVFSHGRFIYTIVKKQTGDK